MKKINKIIITFVGVTLVAASFFATKNLSESFAKEGETADIIFDGQQNSFIDKAGECVAYTSNNNTVNYSIFYTDNLEVSTNGYSLTLRSTDDQPNRFTMQFLRLKGVRKVFTSSSKRTVINATAYKYKTEDVIGYNEDTEVPQNFEYTFPIDNYVSDLWMLSLTLKCPANTSVTFANIKITYSVDDCKALNY